MAVRRIMDTLSKLMIGGKEPRPQRGLKGTIARRFRLLLGPILGDALKPCAEAIELNVVHAKALPLLRHLQQPGQRIEARANDLEG